MFFGSRWKMKSVTAAEAAALAAWRVMDSGDRVGAVVYDDTDLSIIPPHRSQERVMEILRQVVDRNHAMHAGTNTIAAPQMLNRTLATVSALAHHDCLVCLIGDGTGIDQETRQHVTRLTEHNDVLSVFVYDPLEQALPDAGRLVFTDSNSQVDFNTGNRKLREAYQRDFSERMQRMEATSRQHAIPILQVHTAAPVLEQVRDQLGPQLP